MVETGGRRGGVRAALRKFLAGYLGETAETAAISREARGTPRLAEPRGLCFNLKHSAETDCVDVASGAEVKVGVDCEALVALDDLAGVAIIVGFLLSLS